jgi:S1-C subfamily serine protease
LLEVPAERGVQKKIALTIAFAAAAAGGLVGAVAGVAFGGNSTVGMPVPAEIAAGSRRPLPPETVYRDDAPGVVVITTARTELPPGPFTPPLTEPLKALGSGIVIDRKGDVVTNDDVVRGEATIRVGFSSGATYGASLVGVDPSSDVAVLRVKAPATALHPLHFADSEKVEVGDAVYAIGNPFGLGRTMTAGIVSALGRDMQAANGLTIPNAIQTDAPIDHGSSGGPLLNREGLVVGVNDRLEGGTADGNLGIGIAVPSNAARHVASELIATGHAEHPGLGVRVEPIDPAVAKAVHGMPSHGVVVARVVANGPAARAGLRAATQRLTVDGETALVGGDSIVAVGGRRIDSPEQLADAVAAHEPGDRVELDVVRAGKSRKVTVTLRNARPTA